MNVLGSAAIVQSTDRAGAVSRFAAIFGAPSLHEFQIDGRDLSVSVFPGVSVLAGPAPALEALTGLARASVRVSIEAASVNTHLPVRDNQVRSADFLDAEHFPSITFASTAVRDEAGRYFVDGDLTIRGTTRPVTLDLDVNGFFADTVGATRVSFSATTWRRCCSPAPVAPRTSGVPAGSGI
jgi:YceI-like domain